MINKTINISRHRGMALLEVLVAMLIFALAIFPLVKLQIMSMDATKAGYYKTETAAVALSLMDYLNANKDDVANGKWDNVSAVAGICATGSSDSTPTPEQQTLCKLLDGDGSSSLSPAGNAVICVFGKRPQYEKVIEGTNDTETALRDMHLISIRAVWYVGKREEPEKKDIKEEKMRKTLNRALTKADCGTDYDDQWDNPENGVHSVLENENIDHIKINMAY